MIIRLSSSCLDNIRSACTPLSATSILYSPAREFTMKSLMSLSFSTTRMVGRLSIGATGAGLETEVEADTEAETADDSADDSSADSSDDFSDDSASIISTLLPSSSWSTRVSIRWELRLKTSIKPSISSTFFISSLFMRFFFKSSSFISSSINPSFTFCHFSFRASSGPRIKVSGMRISRATMAKDCRRASRSSSSFFSARLSSSC